MSENSRHYFNLAKVILDASFLEESVLIQEALSMKGSDDHKKKKNNHTQKPTAICKGEGYRGSARGLLHPSEFLARKLFVSIQARLDFLQFCIPTYLPEDMSSAEL